MVKDFSLTKSGLLNKLLLRLGLAEPSPKGYARRSLAIIGITWLPLMLLSALQGVAYGDLVEITFLKDFAVHTRFLIVIPLLTFAESTVDFRLKELTAQFFKAGILGESDHAGYEKLKKSTRRLSESVLVDVLMLVIVAANISIRWMAKPPELSHWMLAPGEQAGISWAGVWYIGLSLPVMQFIILRWLWRWVIWFIYFYKISKMPLKLNPAHPDLAGGIGFLGMPPAPFFQVTLALATLFAAAIAQQIAFLHRPLSSYYVLMGSYVLFFILLNVLPLLVFMNPLLLLRRRGVFEYSALIQKSHGQFDEKWLDKNGEEGLPDNKDVSTLAAFNLSFNAISSMRIVPFDLKIMASSIIIAVLPMVPLFAFEYNWLDLIGNIFSLLF
jgi:hypothetical protein